nr:periphilin-1-like [Macaca nemestrina]
MGQTWQVVPHLMNTAMDHDRILENEGEVTVQSSWIPVRHIQPYYGMAETQSSTRNEGNDPAGPTAQMMQLPWTTQTPDIMLKKTTLEAEQILLQTQTPFTPDNLFLAILSVVHCNSHRVLDFLILSLHLQPVPVILY